MSKLWPQVLERPSELVAPSPLGSNCCHAEVTGADRDAAASSAAEEGQLTSCLQTCLRSSSSMQVLHEAT